jgi:sugar phosphate isomerase/epimerase
MTFSCPEWDLDTILKKASEYGYEGFEPRVEAGHKHGIELALTKDERRLIRTKCEDSGIILSCLATSVKYSSPDEVEYRENIKNCKDHIVLASDLGIKLLRVFGGRIPEPKEENREKFYNRIAKGLRDDGLFADEHGVNLCLETHDDFCRVKNAVEILRRADCPGVSVNWDFTHSILHGDDPKEAYPLIKGKVTHLHTRDNKYKGEGKPFPAEKSEFIKEDMYKDWEDAHLGEGDMPVKEVMKIMAEDNFEGFFSLEWAAWSPEVGLPKDAQNFRKIREEIANSNPGGD